MNIAPNPYQNRILSAPADMPDCHSLEIYDDGERMISFWEPTDEEIEAIKNGAKVLLHVWSRIHPPVLLSVEEKLEFAATQKEQININALLAERAELYRKDKAAQQKIAELTAELASKK